MYEDNERVLTIWRRILRIILVLSMIGSGVYFLTNLVWGVSLPIVKEMFESGDLSMPEEMTVMMEQMVRTPRSFYLCSALLYAVSLIGVILMWNIRKSGFHLYTLAQLLVLLIGVLFIGKDHLVLGDVMLTVLFVTYYFLAMKRLGAFNREDYTAEKTTLQEDKTDNENSTDAE